MQKRIALLSIGLLLLLSFTGIFPIDKVSAVEPTIYVDDNNIQGPWDGTSGHPFRYIQDGIDAVAENGTVYVFSGTYCENIIINKTIDLIGDGKGNTTIDGCESGNVVDIFADNASMSGFTVENGTDGIKINGLSSNNTITENTIKDTGYGIYIENLSNSNIIYHNNLLNNTQNAYDNGSNTWDDGYPSGGNYWDDYIGTDDNGDGIGNSTYDIPGGNNRDRYPMMEPITELPDVDFTYTPLNPTTQDVVQFADTSTDSDGYLTSWSWNFGDGNTSIEQNPTHRYADNGTYTVTLTVTDDYGVSNETSQQIVILNVGPTADFGYSPVNPTDLQEVNFTDMSLDLDGYIAVWSWNFGDGNTSTERNPIHQYADNGTYTVTLTVTDDDGAGDGISQQLFISNVGPTAGFRYSPANPTINDTVQFTDVSIDNDGTIVSWYWDLGDGTTSNECSPAHNYTKVGGYKVTYKVSLTVTDNDGDSDTKTKYITVIDFGVSGEGGKRFDLIYIVYLVLFVIMVGIVIFLNKKYG